MERQSNGLTVTVSENMITQELSTNLLRLVSAILANNSRRYTLYSHSLVPSISQPVLLPFHAVKAKFLYRNPRHLLQNFHRVLK